MRRARVHIEIPFHDVDMGGIAWHGHYYKYFELARTELFRAADLDVQTLTDLRCRVVVTNARCRYASPLRYGDTATVAAWFHDVGPAVEVWYEITRADGERVARGSTTVAAVSQDADTLTTVPEVVKHRIAAWQHDPEADADQIAARSG